MNIGMLWQDNDPKASLEEKVLRAAEYYRSKYGRQPNLCFVHPSLVGSEPVGGAVEVRASSQVRPNYFWVGVDEKASVK